MAEKGLSPIRVVYIIGSDHTGSTVLDTILGNHPSIESVGELCRLSLSVWFNNEYCACGERVQECRYWSAVVKIWQERVDWLHMEEYFRFQMSFERTRSLQRLLRERKAPCGEFRQYAYATRCLFEAIQTVSGKSVIVDSSKNPMRAFALLLNPGLDLRFVHIVRDARGVAWSNRKARAKNERTGIPKTKVPRPAFGTALRWNLVNLQSSWTMGQVATGSSIRIRYEDLVERPDDVLNEIGAVLKLDFGEIASAVKSAVPMPVGHTVSGNRVRMTGKISLRADLEWTEKLSAWHKWQVWLLSGWLMRYYGYSKQVLE